MTAFSYAAQAAAEYGGTTRGVASEVRNSLQLLKSSALGGWRTVSSQPMVLVGGVLILLLVFLFFRDPAR